MEKENISYHKWTQEEVNLLRNLVEQSLTDKQISAQMGLSYDTVFNKRRHLKLKSKNRKFIPWTADELDQLQLIAGTGKRKEDIAKDFNRTPGSVDSRLRKLKIANPCHYRKNFHNEFYWREIDEQKAYFVGFLAADSAIDYPSKNGVKVFIRLKDTDRIELFKKQFEYTGPIATTINKKGEKLSGIAVFDSQHWKNDLIALGVVPDKTKHTRPSRPLSEYIHYCILVGMLDGDGCIAMGKSKKNNKIERKPLTLIIQLTGSAKDYIFWFEELVKRYFAYGLQNRESKIKEYEAKDVDWYGSYAAGGLRAALLFHFLSKFSINKLDRKWKNPEVLEYVDKQKFKYPERFREVDCIFDRIKKEHEMNKKPEVLPPGL